MKLLKLNSPAKINIGLEVLNKRIDGYHNINTIFHEIGLSDILEFELLENSSDIKIIDLSGTSDISIVDNLIYKAAVKLQNKYKINQGVEIRFQKIIPMGGGLGGGSSNAAYTLKALIEIWKIKPQKNEIEIIAQALGSDVPFFLRGGTAYAGSRGESLRYFDFKLPYNIVIVNPRIHVNTSEAYKMLNRNNVTMPKSNFYQILMKSNENPTILRELIKNDFEKVVFEMHPEIAKIKNELYAKGAIFAQMSGSGSTVYGFYAKDFDTSEVIETFEGMGYGIWSC